jgi:hypothetical protein
MAHPEAGGAGFAGFALYFVSLAGLSNESLVTAWNGSIKHSI